MGTMRRPPVPEGQGDISEEKDTGLGPLLLTAKQAAAICGKPLVIVGGGPNEAHWRAHAKRMNLANVHFLGSVSDEDKDALLGLCAGLVLPSNVRAEAFGLSLVEAAMLSRAMVSCEIGTGTSYVNVDGETGYVVPPNDAAALGGAMKRLVEEPETARKMGAAARLRYEALFTRERMAAAYAELYARIVRGASGCGQRARRESADASTPPARTARRARPSRSRGRAAARARRASRRP